MKNETKKFLYLPNGKPVSTLKNEAKKLKKSGVHGSLSLAQNALSKELFNKSFNKLSEDIEIASPFIDHGVLYLPFEVSLDKYGYEGSFYYFMAVNDKTAALGVDFKINMEEYTENDFINSLSLSDIEKVNGMFEGWSINIPNNDLMLEVKNTDEGICADLYNSNGEDCLDTTYIAFEEMYDSLMNHEPLNDKELSDYRAASLFGHTDDSMSVMIIIGGVHFNLFSSWVLEKDGEFYTPDKMLSELLANEDNIEEFYNWLEGQDNDKYSDFIVYSNPYFGLETENGGMLGEVFDTLPRKLTDRCKQAAEVFIFEE